MNFNQRELRTALVLVSGGLDSQLAVCVLRRAGVMVKGIVFDSPFFDAEKGRRACHNLGVQCHTYNFLPDIIELIDHPKHGFGGYMNPCIDCHARMLKRAGQMLPELGCDFLATGEVLDERPMSQSRRTLKLVENDSSFSDLILRPLSALHLEPTLPERDGWIDREKLLDLRGRGRKRQFALAKEFGITDYPTPAGGCRLTEPNFCRRLKDMKEHEGIAGARDIQLLKIGRHFRLGPSVKLIVGRDAEENARIEASVELYDLLLKVDRVPGPSALLPLTAGDDEILLSARICASYSDAPRAGSVSVKVKSSRGTRIIKVDAAQRPAIESIMI